MFLITAAMMIPHGVNISQLKKRWKMNFSFSMQCNPYTSNETLLIESTSLPTDGLLSRHLSRHFVAIKAASQLPGVVRSLLKSILLKKVSSDLFNNLQKPGPGCVLLNRNSSNCYLTFPFAMLFYR